MFHHFPYTNMHELNLDWLIEQVKKAYSPDNPPENIVMSVNGLTGNVVLYEASIVRLPDVTDEQWNIYRMTAGNTARGIEFSADGSAKIIDGTNRDPIYTRDNPPPYPVQSVNGMTGNVQLFQEGNIQLPPIEAAQWNVYRFADEKAVGIKMEKDQAIYRINGSDRVKIYDEENPPPYPVTSVNGQTGAVVITFPVTSVNGQTGAVNIQVPFVNTSTEILDFQTDSPDDYWGMLRNTTNGEAGIYFSAENDTVKAYITYMPEDESSGQGQTFQLLTTNDIPESSGVVSINGKTGVVVIRATDIARTENNSETVEAALTRIDLKDGSQDTSISELQQAVTRIDQKDVTQDNNISGLQQAVTRIDQKDVTQDNNISGLQSDVTKIHQSIAIIADGDTHAAIQAGQAVFVKNHSTLATGLYWASAAIGTDAALTSSNLTADTNGGFNHLQGDIASLNNEITNLVIMFGTSSKNLTQNLTDNWQTAVPNDSRVYFVRIISLYGDFYGVICRYSDVYGAGIVSRYDGRVYRIQMDNGSCSSYQLQNRPIEVLSTGSKTITSNGNISYTFSNKVLVLGVYSASSDIVCSAYPSSGADSSGSATWWIHCRNANSSSSVASGTITCYIIYIDMA